MIESAIPAAWLINFALLALRMAAVTTFVPLPGRRRVFPVPKIVLGLLLSALLAPLARTGPGPELLASDALVPEFARMALAEAALGIAVGVCFRLALEAFGLAAQILGFQAGYSYVNMVDPTSQVDASILNVLLALLGSLLFFAMDLHLFIVRTLAESLEVWPLGGYRTRPGDAFAMVELGGRMLAAATRLALPVMAILLLIDLTLGILNQAHNRMQLLTLAFPAKIVAAVAALIPVLWLAPRVFHSLAEDAGELALALVAR